MRGSHPSEYALADSTSTTLRLDARSAIHEVPAELLIECVNWLQDGSDDRIYASQVSKGWREVLLAAPHLWTTIDIRSLSHPAAEERLDTFLQRSEPFDIHLLVGLAGAGETALIEANVARFRALTLKWRLEPEETLWTLTWPRLRRLEIGVDLFQSPEEWGGDCMPALETFVLRSFLFFEPRAPFTALRNFEGRMGLMEGEFSDARALFALFPNLVSLVLAGVWDPDYLPQGAPPASLRDVRFDSAYGQAINLSDYLAAWTGHAFRSISLESSVLAVPLQLFLAPHNHCWQLTAGTEGGRPAVFQAEELGGGGSRLRVRTSLGDLGRPRIFAHVTPQLARLTVLVLGGAPLLAVREANLTFPAVVELTHRDTAAYIGSDIGAVLNPESDSESQAVIYTPVLRHLTFELISPDLDAGESDGEGNGTESDGEDSDTESEGEDGGTESSPLQELTAVYLKSYIATCIRYEASRLESITVIGHSEETLRSAGVHALGALATSVYGQCTPSAEKILICALDEL